MKLPESTTEISNWIIKNVGFDMWVKFCNQFGGQNWWIPSTPAASARDAQIRRLYTDLMKTPGVKQRVVYDQLSKKFEISIRTLRRIL